MVFSVEILVALPGDDPARAAIPAPWRLDGVFAVIAARLDGQALLEVAENDAVAFIRKGTASLDQRQGSLGTVLWKP